MNYRAFIFDDDKGIRQILWSLFDNRGYEVFTFPYPAACPLSEEEVCPCPRDQACSDVIMSDVDMPGKSGLDFLEEQINKGCRCKHIAVMSGAFTDEHISKVELLGIKMFKKPFKLTDVINWLDQVEKDVDPNRKLSDWFLKKMSQISEE